MPSCPRLYVTVPNAAAGRYGLVDSAIPIDTTDRHAACGIQFEPLACEPSLLTHDGCPTPAPAKVITRGIPLVEADPFTVYHPIACSAPSFTDASLRARVTAQLNRGESRAVEQAFWEGNVLGVPLAQGLANAALSDDAIVLSGGVCLSPCGALGALEGALADCYGSGGYIHAPAAAMPALFHDGYVQRDGTRLRTPMGTTIIAGGGYPGTGPDGAAPSPGCVWVFASGSVYLWRSAVDFTAGDPSEIINRENNDMVLIAERTYVVAFDCCLFAVQMDVSCC